MLVVIGFLGSYPLHLPAGGHSKCGLRISIALIGRSAIYGALN